jgi:hypothetical protein
MYWVFQNREHQPRFVTGVISVTTSNTQTYTLTSSQISSGYLDKFKTSVNSKSVPLIATIMDDGGSGATQVSSTIAVSGSGDIVITVVLTKETAGGGGAVPAVVTRPATIAYFIDTMPPAT